MTRPEYLVAAAFVLGASALAADHLRLAAAEAHPGNRAMLVELARRRWERAVQCAGDAWAEEGG